MTEQNTNTTYQEQVKADFGEFFAENYGERYQKAETEQEKSNLIDEAFQEALIDDGVTGNASGSYYMNAYKARDMVLDNIDHVANLLYRCDVTDKPLEYYLANFKEETLDVLVRYHTLELMFENGELNEFF